jgi:hypothetical protein
VPWIHTQLKLNLSAEIDGRTTNAQSSRSHRPDWPTEYGLSCATRPDWWVNIVFFLGAPQSPYCKLVIPLKPAYWFRLDLDPDIRHGIAFGIFVEDNANGILRV